jgi:hypothetical protein
MTKTFAQAAAVAAAFALGLAVPAYAEAANASAKMDSEASMASDSPAKAAANERTRYCFKQNVTGSRLPQKLCKTKAQWKSEGVEFPTK